MKRILRFTASWCQPCKTMSKLIEDIGDKTIVEVVDIDVSPEIGAEYGIRSVPTLVMLDGNIENKRLVGLTTKEKLTEWIND